MTNREVASSPQSLAWYRYPHVWLVIAGPLLVVIAGIATAWIAVSGADPVVDPEYYRKGLEINQTLQNPQKSFAPALKSRNHAATPQDDQPSLNP